MTSRQYLISLVLGASCLLFSVLLLIAGLSTQGLQRDLAAQQDEINKGALSQQYGTSVLRDMLQVGATNPRMRALLGKYGINFTVNTNPPAARPAASK
jgi:hypothetical protein